MKQITLLLATFLFWNSDCRASIDTFIVKRFRQIIKLIESDNAQGLSKLVNYPLSRQNPLPDIENANAFVLHYHILFDDSLKTLLKQYNDDVILERNGSYGLVGRNFSGEIWIDSKGKISALNYSSKAEQKAKQTLTASIKKQMYPTINRWNENVLVAKSEKLLIRIDRTDSGLRYISWSKGRTMKDPPDIVLYNGIEEARGTMGGWTWTFTNGTWVYLIDDVQMCDNSSNCGLFLELLVKEELKTKIRLKETK